MLREMICGKIRNELLRGLFKIKPKEKKKTAGSKNLLQKKIQHLHKQNFYTVTLGGYKGETWQGVRCQNCIRINCLISRVAINKGIGLKKKSILSYVINTKVKYQKNKITTQFYLDFHNNRRETIGDHQGKNENFTGLCKS